MNKKRSNRVRFIIALFITLGLFFLTYIAFYWSFLNGEFLQTNEVKYKEISNNLAANFQSKINIVEHDILSLQDFLSTVDKIDMDFLEQFQNKVSVVLQKDEDYKGFFLVLAPSYSADFKTSKLNDELFDTEKRFNVYINKNDFGGLRLSNYMDYANKSVVENYSEMFDMPSKRIVFPVSREGKKLIVFIFPAYHNQVPIGFWGVEMKIDFFQEKLKLFYDKDRNTRTVLTSSEGKIIALSPMESGSYIGLDIKDIFRKYNFGKILDRKDSIQELKDEVLIETPVSTINSEFPWQIKLFFDKSIFRKLSLKIILLNTSLALLAFIALIVVLNNLFKTYNIEVLRLNRFGKRLEMGLLKKDNTNFRTSEFGDIVASLNKVVDFESDLSDYLDVVYQRDYSKEMPLRSKNDLLVNKLNSLVKRLAKSRSEAELQAVEVAQRNWGRQALADFANILASTDRSLEDLSSATLRKFSDIFGLIIGAIYIKKETNEEKYSLRLASAFALDHDKKTEKIVQYGEGFVGATAIEQKPLFVDEVPDNYLEISTGLGRSKPKFLIFVPLIYEQNTVGVLELATLKEISDFEKQFIVNVSDNIAIALSGVLVNRKTQGLLEQSKKQSTMLQLREEELQKNINELKELQELSEKTNLKLEAITNSIDFNFYSFAFDLKGHILEVNSYFVEDFKLSEEDLLGKSFENISSLAENSQYYTNLWSDLQKGIVRRETEMFIFNETKRNVLSFYTPIKDVHTHDINTVYLFALDISSSEEVKERLSIAKFEKEKLEIKSKKEISELKDLNRRFRGAHKDLLKIIEAIDKRIVRIEYEIDGSVIKANSLYYKMMGYSSETEVEGLSEKLQDNEAIQTRWKTVMEGRVNEVLTKVRSKSGKEYWWNIIDIPILDRSNNVVKVMSIAIDLTKEKQAEIKIRDGMTNEAIQRKKLQQKMTEMETKVNILSEENKVKEALILKLKSDLRKK